jgi:heat shock protein HslJ
MLHSDPTAARGIALAASIALAACGGGTAPDAQQASPPISEVLSTPTLERAANATYSGIWESGVTLVDGGYESEASRQRAWLIEGVSAVGDLDGDGVDDRIVVLGENSGGTGSFVYVSALLAADQGDPLRAVLVGDRVQLRGIDVDAGEIRLAVVQAGEQDAMCCPGERATRRWSLSDGALREEPMQETGRLSLEAVAGDWTLVAWNIGEPVELEAPITLTIAGTRLAGNSGCNQYQGEATEGDMAGDLTVGPLAGTRKMCPEPLMEAERRYLAALSGATRFGFLNGRLAISTEAGDAHATLLFERSAD